MTTNAQRDQRERPAPADEGDALDLIEIEIAVLARSLEGMQRRSDIHRDLDRASYLIARTLDATGPVSINGLAARLGLDATTVTRQVAAMETTRLLLRRADPADRRVKLISLSPSGRRRMHAVQLARRDRLADLLAGWPDQDRRDLGRLLSLLNAEISQDIGHDRTGEPRA